MSVHVKYKDQIKISEYQYISYHGQCKKHMRAYHITYQGVDGVGVYYCEIQSIDNGAVFSTDLHTKGSTKSTDIYDIPGTLYS